MGLRDKAAAHARQILENDTTGAGMPILIKPPGAAAMPFIGFTSDISLLVEPDTGASISSRTASVAVAMAALTEAGFDLPTGDVVAGADPWLIDFADINDTAYTFKVRKTDPDRALGVLVIWVENWVA